MHTPEKWKMKSNQDIHRFINANGFAAIISDNLEASHLPLMLNSAEGDQGTLYGHFAKSNSHWKPLDGAKVLVIFSGPHAYISPTWYQKQPAVPTWNYSAVHVTGVIQLTDHETTIQALEQLVEKYEPSLEIAEDFKMKLAHGIVGFKINITSMQGKEKLGQHRSKEDQLGVSQALSTSADLESQLLHQYMRDKDIGIGN